MTLRAFGRWLKDLIFEIHRHRLSDEAAKIAYFLLISLFPFLLVLFSLVGPFRLRDGFGMDAGATADRGAQGDSRVPVKVCRERS